MEAWMEYDWMEAWMEYDWMEAWMEYDWMMDDRQGSGYWTPGDNRVTIETHRRQYSQYLQSKYIQDGWKDGWLDGWINFRIS